jgi:hypothetical protein
VCLALTALWQGAVSSTLAGVVVADGPQANSDPSPDLLFVAYDGVADSGALIVDATQNLMAFQRVKGEDASVTCSVVSYRGEPDVISARARAFAVLAAAEDLLRANMTLGGLVMHAFVSSHQYYPSQTETGAMARVVFTVTYKAQL